MFIDVICYDDACHLKKYAINSTRNHSTETSKILQNMEYVVDKFHFKNHVDTWCKNNCNPYKCNKIKDVGYYIIKTVYTLVVLFRLWQKKIYRLIVCTLISRLILKFVNNCFRGCPSSI